MERGNKLWESHRMILPEHEEVLWQARQREKEYRMPELEEDALQEISRWIEWSYLEEQPILLTVAGKYVPRKFIGYVTRIDPVERVVLLKNGEEKEQIPFSIIIGAGELGDEVDYRSECGRSKIKEVNVFGSNGQKNETSYE